MLSLSIISHQYSITILNLFPYRFEPFFFIILFVTLNVIGVIFFTTIYKYPKRGFSISVAQCGLTHSLTRANSAETGSAGQTR